MGRLSQVFLPRDREFFDLFEEASGNILRAAELLERMLRDYPENSELAREILICEQQGDRITHDIIQRLNDTFVTPIDREDILALASSLDDIVDYIEEVADFLGPLQDRGPDGPGAAAGARARCSHAADRRGDAAAARLQGPRRTTRSRSTGWRTTATGSSARRLPRCSTTASTRWS